jgi:hypothetical protein
MQKQTPVPAKIFGEKGLGAALRRHVAIFRSVGSATLVWPPNCGAASACFTDFGLSGIRGGGGRLAGGDSHIAHGDLIWDHVSPPRGMAVIPRRVEQYWN